MKKNGIAIYGGFAMIKCETDIGRFAFSVYDSLNDTFILGSRKFGKCKGNKEFPGGG